MCKGLHLDGVQRRRLARRPASSHLELPGGRGLQEEEDEGGDQGEHRQENNPSSCLGKRGKGKMWDRFPAQEIRAD